MLWDAGQQRVIAERRSHLAAMYVAGRDAYIGGNVALGKAKSSGGAWSPGYAREAAPGPSAEAQSATIARLARMFPGAVRRGDS
jgi:hypothetical protein